MGHELDSLVPNSTTAGQLSSGQWDTDPESDTEGTNRELSRRDTQWLYHHRVAMAGWGLMCQHPGLMGRNRLLCLDGHAGWEP